MIAAGKGEHAGMVSGRRTVRDDAVGRRHPDPGRGRGERGHVDGFPPVRLGGLVRPVVPVAWKGADDLGRGHFTPTARNPDNPELLADRAKAGGGRAGC